MTTRTDWDLGLPDMVQAQVAPAAYVAFLEGPAADAHGNVYFTDIINNRILRLDTKTGQYVVWRADSGRSNGLLFDPEGRLVACEGNEFGPGGRRRITRTTVETGEVEILTDQFQGVPYNSPNDLAITSDGRIFFTDPCYGDRTSMFLQHESVYRRDPDGLVEFVITQPLIDRPNGIALSPDEQTLYVVDSCPTPNGNRKIWAFDLTPVGRVQNQRLVCDFAPGRGGDGMAVDIEGNL
ncbi:MAG TPA: SMP-30/gluconolactonase/LRE family protein, partial [Planctomycetaceae bacterium]|nr:SMP-30/gluconolactonase/LRE family protein [Planctomycetaceae bacterium]